MEVEKVLEMDGAAADSLAPPCTPTPNPGILLSISRPPQAPVSFCF